MEGADNHSTQRAGPPEPQAREPLSHVRRHGQHNLLQTGRFRHNSLGGRRSHPQADLQPLPLSTAFRRLSNGGIFVVSHLSNHSKTQDRDRQDDKTETPRNVGYTHRNARPRHRFLALACLAQYLQTLRARRRPTSASPPSRGLLVGTRRWATLCHHGHRPLLSMPAGDRALQPLVEREQRPVAELIARTRRREGV